jgi:hypothetical protein
MAHAQIPGNRPNPTTDESTDRTPRSGKILDDSTKQVYGPETSRYLTETDLLNNRDTTYAVDSVLDNIHNYNFVNRSGNRYVDLGNLGTAMRQVFYTPPPQIGTYFGINAYTPYLTAPENVRYFDTKSPYTSLRYVQGGLFQQLLNVTHTRNINPRWNIGLDYQRLTSSRQYGYNSRNERHADDYAVVVHTRWISADSNYHILAHFSHLNHHVNEQGGLLDSLSADPDNLITNYQEEGQSQLPPLQGSDPTVRSNDYRNNWHVYHQYKFGNGFQVYHIFDRQTHRYSYNDYENRYDNFFNFRRDYFYPDVNEDRSYRYYFSDDSTRDNMRYVLYENRIGLKGTFRGWDYRLYARRRDFSVTYGGDYQVFRGIPYINPTNTPYEAVRERRSENFLGAWGQYNFRKNIRLYAEGEYLLFRDYKLSATFESPWFRAGYLSMLYSPTLVQQRMSGNHFRWNDDLKTTSVNQLFGQLNLKYKALYFEPSVTVMNLANYVYFDQTITPKQSTPFQVVQLGATLAFHGKVFHAINQAVFTQTTTDANVIRMPTWFLNARWYAEGYLFKKALYMQLGFDAHYKSDYYADAYMPAIAQFYLQDNFLVRGYPVIDVFANARVGRVRLFAKMSHVNQGVVFGNGYFTSAYYPGQRRAFGFGVIWPLFD